ncbi:hypothetical protein K4661_005093, partial [Salmonella enterica]|nr:hypothetical protein [Salmonella enterica]
TARYISSVLFSEMNIIDTGNQQQHVIDAITTFLEREFLIDISNQENQENIDQYNKLQSISELKKEKEKLTSSINALNENYFSLEKKSSKLLDEINELNIKILPLETELAKEEKPITKLQLQLDALVSLKKDKEIKLKEAHTGFTNFLNGVESEFFRRADEIQNEFNKIVQGFLIEDCEVTWAKTDWKLGQEERPIKFPAFLFKMSSNAHSGITVRTKPSQVSESQREFIDLAFRISLIKVTAYDGCGSIVMDAPESSLDAVFVDRAAHIFNKFSSQGNNKLILASNLIDGLLLP